MSNWITENNEIYQKWQKHLNEIKLIFYVFRSERHFKFHLFEMREKKKVKFDHVKWQRYEMWQKKTTHESKTENGTCVFKGLNFDQNRKLILIAVGCNCIDSKCEMKSNDSMSSKEIFRIRRIHQFCFIFVALNVCDFWNEQNGVYCIATTQFRMQ